MKKLILMLILISSTVLITRQLVLNSCSCSEDIVYSEEDSTKFKEVDKSKMVISKYQNHERLYDIYKKMHQHNIIHADVVLAQIILETGWLTSKATDSLNNITGFSYCEKLIDFECVEACIERYSDWQKKKIKLGLLRTDSNKKKTYYKFLQKINYAEDSLYVEKLKKLENSVSNFDKLYQLEACR